MSKAGTLRFLVDLGLRVVELREQMGLTQEELAERVKFSVRYVQRIEAGRANISVAFLPDLASALKCRVPDLVEAPGRGVARRPGRPKVK